MEPLLNKTLESFLAKAKFSQAAYLNDKEAKASFKKLGIDVLLHISGPSTQVYIGRSKANELIISFRGTEADVAEDILTDLRFKKVKECGGEVHQGFLEGLDEVYPEIESFLSRTRKSEQVVVTGHSLGGALALLCGVRLRLKMAIDDVSVFTYGQPKVGDKAFIKIAEGLLGESYFRIVNDEDLVPKLPTYIKMKFDHNNTVYFINDEVVVTKQPEGYQHIENLVDYVKEVHEVKKKNDKEALKFLIASNAKEAVGDHSINEYVRLLQIAVDRESNPPEQTA